MNFGINNTAFKGSILFLDDKKNYQNLDTKNIKKLGVDVNGDLVIDLAYDRGFDVPGNARKINESYTIPALNTKDDYDRLLRIYDIASRNNVTIKYPNVK